MNFFTGHKTIDLFQPAIEVKKRLKKVKISGVSRMPDPVDFYFNMAEKLTDLFHDFRNTLFIEFELEYVNTGSSKWIFHMLHQLEKLANEKGMIEVSWLYEKDDETILETGQLLKSELKIPLTLKEI